MTTYRLFPTTSGPSTATAYTGSYIAGLNFYTTDGGWLDGYWWWCCGSGQSTAPVSCALWQLNGTSSTTGTPTLVPGSTATSATLAAGAWNYIPLSTPLQLAPGIAYIAAVGMSNSFPFTTNFWGTGGPGVNGIVNGILTAPSDLAGAGGTLPPSAWSNGQGLYTTTSSDPTVAVPYATNSSFNSWVDVQVDTNPPSGYSGSYRLWPGMTGASADYLTQTDAAANFVLSTEVHLSQTCTVNKVWFFSPPGVAQLPTDVKIWRIDLIGLTGLNAYANASPSWSGAAGSGWVSATVAGLTLSPDKYKVSVHNGAATPLPWSSHRFSYWAANASGVTQPAAAPNGITDGPLYAPNNGSAVSSFSFGNTGSTGTHVTGDLTETGNGSFAIGSGNADPGPVFPNLVVGVNSASPGPTYESFWVDLEVTPVTSGVTATVGGLARLSSAVRSAQGGRSHVTGIPPHSVFQTGRTHVIGLGRSVQGGRAHLVGLPPKTATLGGLARLRSPARAAQGGRTSLLGSSGFGVLDLVAVRQPSVGGGRARVALRSQATTLPYPFVVSISTLPGGSLPLSIANVTLGGFSAPLVAATGSGPDLAVGPFLDAVPARVGAATVTVYTAEHGSPEQGTLIANVVNVGGFLTVTWLSGTIQVLDHLP